MHTDTPAAPARRTHPIAGVLAGLVGGCAYLLAQLAFAATVLGGTGWEPLERISAMLLGEQFLPVTGDVNLTIAGFALLIHFAFSMVFGRIVDVVVRGGALPFALGAGVLLGLALYGLDYWLVAPLAFPWFDGARGVTTVLDHAAFGAITAAAYVALRSRWQVEAPDTPALQGR
ncbi:hypothetical protein [Ramlibacter algicola]|uniref:Uncharacterized protein n=1 Tax=Ramlibacter algicola TaxID=2795217 RepID=A0A934PWX8_9BURK|nr:hypothetical protein [Ramlibacter algicola]MBK0392015.1 hypothetical protein [Ramlibacter algicola]